MRDGTRPAAARRAAHGDLFSSEPAHPLQLFEGGADGLIRQASPALKIVSRQRTVVDRGQHGPQGSGAHETARPIWNTTTATIQATLNCIATPNTVHLRPISRHWVARVATHGV